MNNSNCFGSCLCGGIRYQVTGELGPLVFCHCRDCRKAQGASFAANSPVEAAHFALLQGQDLLSVYYATPHKGRYFCRRCAAPIYSRIDGEKTLRLRCGTLDEWDHLVPAFHIFTATRPDWDVITDSLPCYAYFEPGRS